MVILGIDPGSRHTGWGVLRWRGGQQEVLADGRVSLPIKQDLPQRLAHLVGELEALLTAWSPEVVAVEQAFFGLNPKSLIVLCQARGAILATLAMRQVEICEYSPAEVKAAIAGNGRADKAQVARMVQMFLGPPKEDRSEDAVDALAIAMCCARRYRMDHLVKSHGKP